MDVDFWEQCRKASGVAFATWGILNAGNVRCTSGEALVAHHASSPRNTRCFCSRCGSSLASAHSGVVGEVAAGTLDGDPGAPPGGTSLSDRKRPGTRLPMPCRNMHNGLPET